MATTPKSPLSFYSEPLLGVDLSELQGKLIVIEGPDAVGRSTQVARLRSWLEQQGHAVLDTGMARSALAGDGIQKAKEGNTLGPVTMTLFYATDFADRLENEILPALRAGFVVLTDRYIFSLMARAIARGEDRVWLEKLAGFALVPHAVYYLRAEVQDLVPRVVRGRGRFDFWESGMDMRFGPDMYDSFVRYQARLIKVLDRMARQYDFVAIDATQSPDAIFAELKRGIGKLFPKSRYVVKTAKPGKAAKSTAKTLKKAAAAKASSAKKKAAPKATGAANGQPIATEA
ncbi:MAG: thymidylate kinase [Acidobacteria bacterium]|nr:thymidylate kinase [Acidobacteriota bacterium]